MQVVIIPHLRDRHTKKFYDLLNGYLHFKTNNISTQIIECAVQS